uniref:Glycerophosphodiester phosphodiesterase n=1 Tax=Aegilops tauschii subsp. strangulata TaxID=200361 RepID=A0A453BVJ4_AEGTS
GTQIHADARRNSLEEAVRLCRAGGLQGIVSEARAVFRHPSAVARVKESDLSLMGVDGVIVDLVQEIAEAVSEFAAVVAPEPSPEEGQAGRLGPDRAAPAKKTPNFSQREISFLLRLIPELVQ